MKDCNITFIAALFALAFRRILGPRRAYWLTISGIALYVLFVGADAPVVRAGLMGVLLVSAIALGRRATAYVSLFATALILTLINPMALWDVGFQLSFAVTLGMILFAPTLVRIAPRSRAGQVLHFLNDALILTLAAQILTIPLVAYHFGRLSLVAPQAKRCNSRSATSASPLGAAWPPCCPVRNPPAATRPCPPAAAGWVGPRVSTLTHPRHSGTFVVACPDKCPVATGSG